LRFWQDGQNKAVRIAKRSDRLASQKDVLKSPEYAAIQAKNGATSSAESRFRLAAHELGIQTEVIDRLLVDRKGRTILLPDFVEQTYLPHAKKNLRAKTVKEYESIWRGYDIAKKVAGMRVADFRAVNGRQILEAIAAKHELSTRTLSRVKFLLSAIMVHAANCGMREDNPMLTVRVPKGKNAPRLTHAYSLADILAMLRPPVDASVRAAIGIAGFAGLRESEIVGLRWSDYDGSDLRVERSIDRVSRQAVETKTEDSRAWVPVIEPLQRLLDTYKAKRTDEERMFPLPNLDGMGRNVIAPAIEAIGVKWRGWHSFRRGIASNLFELGVPAEVVQRILRHSNVETTRQSYVKVRDPLVDSAMAQLTVAISKAGYVQ
jgi:integrase